MSKPKEFQPIFIIGAARSGTNMLRDVLSQIKNISTWPCDEINYIWKYKNKKVTNDEFTEDNLNLKIKKYIRNSFLKLAKKTGSKYVLEKTCANSLRIPFINSIFPSAKYILIIRDGRDVVNSASQRWRSSLDITYILKKARYIPVFDIPYYAYRYIQNRLYKIFSKENRIKIWGPVYKGMLDDVRTDSAYKISAKQWVRSVNKAKNDLNELCKERTIIISYEEFVENPIEHVLKICKFIGVSISDEHAISLTKNISKNSVGKWKKELSPAIENEILPLIKSTLVENGY